MLELERLADEHGAHIALEADGVQTSYAGLAGRVARVRRALVADGLEPSDRVAFVCPPASEALVGALAVVSAGCAILPLDAGLTADELTRHADAFRADWIAPGGGPLRATGRPRTAREPRHAGLAQALLSSGSTGTPKLVLRTRDQVAARLACYAKTLALGPSDRVLGVVSFGHSHGFNGVLLGSLCAGATIVLPAARHPRDLAQALGARGISFFGAPPIFLDLMARFAEGEAPVANALRACLSVGDALPRRTWARFAETFGVAPWQSYGASEAGPALLNRSGAAGEELMALGRPYHGVEVALCDEAGEPVAEGETGEIVVRSAAVGLCYEGSDDGAGRIEGDRFFTGDLGRRLDGEIHFAGRRKLLIAVAGRKVSPEEVEQVLRRHPAVADAAVVARREGAFDRIAALVVARRAVTAQELVSFCSGSLAPHKLPRIVEFRDALPRSPVGKLLRDRLA